MHLILAIKLMLLFGISFLRSKKKQIFSHSNFIFTFYEVKENILYSFRFFLIRTIIDLYFYGLKGGDEIIKY